MSISQVLSLYDLFLFTIASGIPIPSVHNATSVPNHDLSARESGQDYETAPEGNDGACGTTIQNGDYAVVLTTGEWQGGSLYGKGIIVIMTNSPEGHSVSGVIVQDLYPGCQPGPRDCNMNNFNPTSQVVEQLDDLNDGLISCMA
ncbi:hypothetical protein Clacol_008608 [Clathrus columnatus]|uniref:Uncharacterized protein n=1 Tax=Clathrus columnatus TaxID=1419009 RepID=A0AAV5AMJ4_9AGAM|nr:hypothetical protein Clacol_008608 [Clathrus columnatus]